MGKHKKRKRNDHQQPPAPVAPPPSSAPTAINLRAADVATTIDTLNYLSENPDALQHKALRELRAALHPLIEAQVRVHRDFYLILSLTN